MNMAKKQNSFSSTKRDRNGENVPAIAGVEINEIRMYSIEGKMYLVAFLLMCFFVKEGEYPPPEPKKGSMIATYFRECFSLSFYRWFFLTMACNDASLVCRTMFNFLFANKDLGLNFEQYGNIMSINMVISFFLLILMGFLVDRFHPLRTYLAGAVLIIGANIFGFFFVWDYTSFFIVSILIAVVYVIQNASKLPMFVALLPGQKYGQFCSANAMVVSIFLIIANGVGGKIIDIFGYRFIFVRDFLFTGLGLIGFMMVYRVWKRRGGRTGYTAPEAGL